MKKTYILLAVLAVFSACSKNAATPEPTKVPMTLTASIAQDPSSKVSYVDDSGLKASWGATETMSVISLDASGRALHIDNFTSTGDPGRSTATFSGSITEDANTKSYVCWYPAANSTSRFTVASNSLYYNWSLDQKQRGNGDLTHVASNSILNGIPVVDGSNINVTLKNRLNVYKLILTLPEGTSGQPVDNIRITSTAKNFAGGSSSEWGYVRDHLSLNYGGSGGASFLVTYTNTPSYMTVPSDRVLTIYAITKAINVTSGTQWTINVTNSSSHVIGSKTLTWNADKTVEEGKMYTISTTLE